MISAECHLLPFVADTAVLTINVQNGVEVGTEIHFRHADKANKPLILAVNGLDHEKSNFENRWR